MTTINVSLPEKLKEQADKLVKAGYFASFSDIVRASLRSVIERNTYDVLTDAALKDYSEGKTTTLKNRQDINKYLDQRAANASTPNHQ